MKKNISLLVIGLLMPVTAIFGQKKGAAPQWPGVSYSYVKVYLYNLDNQLHGQYQPVKKDKLDATVVGEGQRLTEPQATELLAILNGDTRVLNDGLSKCYEPHHAFVFYDDKDNIVASTDVCFLCQGVKFYPAKKYYKELDRYSSAMTKAAEKQLEEIKSLVQKTEIPVYKTSGDYLRLAEKMAKEDTLHVKCDTIFSSLVRDYKNIKALLARIPNGESCTVDSTKRYVAGGDKVMFYSIKGKNISIECSSYNAGHLWITAVRASENPAYIFNNRIDIHMRKYELFESLQLKSYPYEKTIAASSNTEMIVFGFDENHYVNSIYYKSHP